MILVDPSVWIHYFNGDKNAHTDALDAALNEGSVALGDLILLEILQGFRKERDYREARSKLLLLDQYPMLNTDLAIKSAENYRRLRKQGITIRKTNDVIIATFCIENRLPLLFLDQDFMPFENHLNLRSALEVSCPPTSQ